MAAASSIARWLLDEASSGTAPTTCADDQGSNDLTIDYSSGDANWTSVAAGNGLDFTATTNTANTAIAELADISTNGDIGSKLDDVSEVSMIVRCDIDAAHNNGMRLIAIGTNSGNTDISLVLHASTPSLRVRWDQEAGGDDDEVSYLLAIPSGIVTVGVSIDTTETVGADRCKLYLDGVLQANQGGTITSGSTLGSINSTNRSFSLGNRPSLNRNIDGKIYYAELFNGVLTATQHSDAHTAIASDNDANWDAPSTTSVLTGTITAAVDEDDITTGGKTLIITLTGDTWKAAGTGPIGSTADTQALIDGFSAASSPTTGWNNEVRDKAATTEIVRTSSTVATWTVAAQAGYDITAQETITGTIPIAALTTGAGTIVSTPTFTIDPVSGFQTAWARNTNRLIGGF